MIVVDDLFRALADAHAIVGEFDTVEDKLAAVGLDAEAVHALLRDRWAAVERDEEADEESMLLFVRGFVEGLLVGKKL